jgi:hypothetical protein
MTVEAVKALVVGGVVELDGHFWVIIGNRSDVLTLFYGDEVLRIEHKAPGINRLKRIR